MARTNPAGTDAVTVPAAALNGFAREVFARSGMPAADAGTVADVLVWANLRGVDSHGVMRMPQYVNLIEAGDLNPRPAITVGGETAAAVLIDTDRAAGPIAMSAAMQHALRKAGEAGIGMAFARATTHTAALGYYTQSAARSGMAAIALSGSIPMMAYHGARAAGVSTSPISIAVPARDRDPLVFDMGTGIVSMGRLNQARKTGQPIPEGWALDRNGNPTTDPKAVHVPLPMAGPKGSGLALMIECIVSLIAGNPLLAERMEGTAYGKRHRQNGMAIAIDVARFGDPERFRREVSRLIAAIKALPPAAGADEVLVPGERGDRVQRQRGRDGIPLPRAIVDELAALAVKLGVPMFA
ncbi:MAG TPA: Ldh family oxidoreductase [Burkholderiales bacterium]|nr:Ldh family oxidoreductase [Burkholderiales bacterium]